MFEISEKYVLPIHDGWSFTSLQETLGYYNVRSNGILWLIHWQLFVSLRIWLVLFGVRNQRKRGYQSFFVNCAYVWIYITFEKVLDNFMRVGGELITNFLVNSKDSNEQFHTSEVIIVVRCVPMSVECLSSLTSSIDKVHHKLMVQMP